MEKTKVLNIKVPATLYDDLKTDAEKKNVSLAAIVRIACSQYLEEQRKK